MLQGAWNLQPWFRARRALFFKALGVKVFVGEGDSENPSPVRAHDSLFFSAGPCSILQSMRISVSA